MTRSDPPVSLPASRWAEVQRVVDGALDRSPAARAAYLDAACGGDSGLRADAARLIDACERAEQGSGFLSVPAAALAGPLLADIAADEAARAAAQRVALADAVRVALAARYTVERELGRGGMATVYLARDLRHDRAVAVKVLARNVAPVDGERFLREIRIAARLTHPHVLGMYDSGEADGLLYYVMPYVAGETLRARLTREGALPLTDAARLLRELADALAYAHGCGVLHRDLKPENVLLSGGHAVVADFGIAKALAVVTGEWAVASRGLTSQGVALGTPAYMAPEQAVGDAVDARADLYAWGVVAYEAVSGRHPFAGKTGAQQLIRAHLAEAPRPLANVARGVPAPLAALVMRCLAKDPADRVASATDVVAALDGVAAATSSRAGGRAPAGPRRTVRWGVVATALLAGAVAVGASVAYRHEHPPAALAIASRAATGGVRLAVLPFRLIGGDSADRYLADGLSEEVNATLADLRGLRVIAQSSVAPIAAKEMRMRAVGAALDADALVTGDVQHAGDALRVRVRLIDPATEEVRWSREFDESTQHVFRIQSDVAGQVAALLRIQLAERESRSLGRPLTTNPAAYDLYLRARTIAARSNSDSRARYDTTIAQLTRAIALDSGFATAWALRANERAQATFYLDAGAPALDAAEFDVRRALALDSNSAIAWQAKGDIAWKAERGWDFPEAVAAIHRATVIQPSDVSAHEDLGSLYLHYGFMEEAGAELATSLSLNPRDGCETTQCIGFSLPRVARVFWYRQQFDSALAVYRRFPVGAGSWTWEYAVVLGAVGRPADGLALLDSTRRAAGPAGVDKGYDREAARGLLKAMLGRRDDALAQIRLATSHPTGRSHFHHAQFTIACAYARLGDARDAVDWLRRAADNGMPNYPLFRDDPNLRGLRGDPGYQALMTRLRQQFDANTRLVRHLRTP